MFDYPYNPRVREWRNSRAIVELTAILAQPAAQYAERLRGILSLASRFEAIPSSAAENDVTPFWNNGWIPALDAMSLYWTIVSEKPDRFVEIGSGNSTKFVRRAIQDHGLKTRIVSIDPHPRAEIDSICDEIIRRPCEDVDVGFFEQLSPRDVLFVDNSHRSFQNSDVTVFFMEILPALPRGTIVGIHDIFLPDDYIPGWEQRYYNEQYLLAAYIFGGLGGGKVLLPNWFISQTPELFGLVDSLWNNPNLSQVSNRGGGAFWLSR